MSQHPSRTNPQATRSPLRYVAIFLALSTLGLGGVVAYQHMELGRLRVALEGSRVKPDSGRKAARVHTSADKPVAEQAGAPSAEEQREREDGPGEAGPRGRGRDRRDAFRAVTNSPEFQKLAQTQALGLLEARYAALFKRMNLSPEALDKFKALLLEKQNAMRDAMEVAREQGLNGRENRDAMNALLKATQAELDASIRSAIGDSAYSQYEQYQQTGSQRNTADQLSQRLSYTGAPLSDAQYDQLVQALGTSTASSFFGGPGGPGGFGGFGGGGGTSVITDAVIEQATGYLSSTQVDTLRKLQAEQQAAKQMQDMLRNANRNQSGTPGS